MSVIVGIFFLIYLLFIIALLAGWNKALKTLSADVDQSEPFLSVIIPFRNEGTVISGLLKDLQRQSYKNFEVILVNDHSQDDGADVVRLFSGQDKRFKILDAFGEGKKKALTQGIYAGRGEIMVTTDGDCRVEKDWLASMTRPFLRSEKIQLVFGSVKIVGDNFFSKMQAHEFLSLTGSAVATWSLGFPTMCNGANLAFRKSAFMEVDGYSGNFHIPSGDDEFLMRKIHTRYSDGIMFANSIDAVVTTSATVNTTQFIHQRIRWAGKWKSNGSIFTGLLAIFIFCFHVVIILLPLAMTLGWIGVELALTLLLLKGLGELIFLRKVSTLLRMPWNWAAFASLQLVYPLYVMGIGVMANFSSFEWKGRKLNSLTVSVIKK